MDTQPKLKSWGMWVGIIFTALLAGYQSVGGNPMDLTTWAKMGEELLKIVSNPVALILFAGAVFGVINNPNNKKGL